MAFETQEYSVSGDELTAQEEAFVQNLSSDASYDAGNVVLFSTNWQMDVTPSGTVDGSNTSFTLPANADDVVVYADGMRVKGGGVDYSHTGGNDTITFTSGRQPYSTISADYLPS